MDIEQKRATREWQLYLQLQQERPELFRAGQLDIIFDLEQICEFERSNDKVIGVLYKSEFSMLVVDLVINRAAEGTGEPFAYERLVPAQPRGSVVCIPRYQDKYVLLRQFRHALRCPAWSFPRGYAEPGIPSEENAAKELGEELECMVSSSRLIGSVAADSGMSGTLTDIFVCGISQPALKSGYEGIVEIRYADETELEEMIQAGELSDGFSLAALELLHVAQAGR